MRALWIAVPILIAASPAAAAPPAPEVPAELSDPALADRLGRMAGSLARSLLDMPIGEVEAAVTGREPTARDQGRRVRDRVGGSDAEREVEEQVAGSARKLQAMGRALMAALPAVMASLESAERELERAAANLPDPSYPKR